MSKCKGLKGAFESLLKTVGEDGDREGLRGTPERIQRAFEELTSGYGSMAKGVGDTENAITFPATDYDAWIEVHGIPFESLCEHHMLPFVGKISIAYWPRNGRVVGLSKLVRFAEAIAHRLQLQENMTVKLAELIFRKANAIAVAVRIEAEHMCMSLRGVRRPDMRIVTSHRCGQAVRWPSFMEM
jgi:GTP cyclohydrolase I